MKIDKNAYTLSHFCAIIEGGVLMYVISDIRGLFVSHMGRIAVGAIRHIERHKGTMCRAIDNVFNMI